jgi:hypothetical protein
MLTPSEYKTYWEKGISYSVYLQRFEKEMNDGTATTMAEKLPINWQRTSRINKHLILDDDSIEELQNLVHKRYWLVLTEHWCGDSAQIVPVMNKIAETSNGKIELRLIYRDQNLSLMNEHLTLGVKSIPKLIQLNTNFEVTGEYGPRPAIAQKLVMDMKSNPLTAPKYSEELHKWYAKDQQVQIQRELMEFINKLD